MTVPSSSSRRPQSPSPVRRSPKRGRRALETSTTSEPPAIRIPTEEQMLAALARAQDVRSGRSVGITVDRPARFSGPRS